MNFKEARDKMFQEILKTQKVIGVISITPNDEIRDFLKKLDEFERKSKENSLLIK